MSQTSLIAITPNTAITSLEDTLKLSEIAVASGMFPAIQDQAKAAMIILAGREIGVPPMAALRGMFVVKGKAEFHAGLLAALIKQSGKYDYNVVEHDDTKCVLCWYENKKGVGRSQFTIEDAKRAGLIKPDSNWQKFPKAMLFARALTSGQRVYCLDIGLGAVYSPGEISENAEMDESSILIVPPDPPAFHGPGVVREIIDANLTPEIVPKVEAARAEQNAKAREKHHPAPTSDSVPLVNTASELRAEAVDLAMAIKKKHKIKHEDVLKQVAEWLGRSIEKFADLRDNEVPEIIQRLTDWDSELGRAV